MQFRDICAQSQKLSLNVLNFARFLHSQILRGQCPLKYPRYHPHLAARQSLMKLLPLAQKILRLIRYILRQFLTPL